MPIDPDFPMNHQTIGKHKRADGEHFHFVWGPGRSDAETSTNAEVQEAYKARGEEYVPLGVHGTMVAVHWDIMLSSPNHLSVGSSFFLSLLIWHNYQ
jgi:hypothetical protein